VPCRKTEKIKDVLARYGLPGRYILYVGNFVPHKNIHRLIRAFAGLKRKGAIEHKLVLCGKTTWAKPAIEVIRKEGMEGEVLIPGFIKGDDLPVIYSGADMFAFVSLYEGFGLPIIEAMSCGVPVIVSNTSSMPEVVGSAGILVDPIDEASISSAIETVANDSELRSRMSAASLERAAMFDWRKTAELTLKAFEKAVS
jgi:glycosyltransferase involved in cell wall biosynthesis